VAVLEADPELETKEDERAGRAFDLAVVTLASTTATIYWALASLRLHWSFHSNGWDLGLIQQVIWNTSEGRFFEYSFRNILYSGDHWQPFLLLLVPLEWVDPGPELLLICQAIVLAGAVIPLFATVRALGISRPLSYAVLGAYVFSLGVAQAVAFDFHIEAFAPLLAFTAMWGLARGNRWAFWLCCLGILTLKEDAGLLTLAICWIAWFTFRQRSAGAIALVAIVYLVVANSVIVPHYRSDNLNPFVERYGYLGTSSFGLLLGIISRPDLVFEQLARIEAVRAVVLVFAAGAFLPLIKPVLLPALGLVTLLALLSQQPPQSALELHYLLIPSTVSLLVAIVALRDRRLMPLLPVSLIAGTAAVVWLTLSPLPPSLAYDGTRFEAGQHDRVAQEFVDAIPDGAIVSVQSAFVPHLAERRGLYQFPRVLDAEYVLTDALGDIPEGDLNGGYYACLRALPRLGFDVVRSEDGLVLRRKLRPAELVPEVPVACSGQHP
jgi:uncharacterized membrane protein